MQVVDKIREAFERRVAALSRMPAAGRGTAVTRVRMRDGLVCECEDGRWNLVVDMAPKSGGSGAGPDPGVFGRAALGSCMAISYGMWAAWRGIPLKRLEVEVQADYDVGATYGVGDRTADYVQIRCIVTVESEAPEADVLRMLDEADAHCPYLEIFRRPQDVRRETRFARVG